MDLKAKVVQSLRWSILAKLSGQVFSWGATLIVMRLLTPADYGLMALATASASFLFLINELGLGAGLIQSPEINEKLLRGALFLVLVINVACFFVLYAAADPLSVFYAQDELAPVMKVIALQFLVVMFGTVPSAMLMRELKFKEISIIDLTSQLVAAAVTLALAVSGYGVWSLVWGQLVMAVSKSLLLNWASPLPGWPTLPGQNCRHLLAFGGVITLQRLLWTVYSRADVFIIGKQLGHAVLGQYSVAFNLASLPMQKVNGVISAVLLVAYSSVQKSADLVKSHLSKTIRLLSVIAFPIFFGLSAVTPEAILLVLGEKWAQAIVPMQILCLVMPLRMILTPVQTALNSTGHVGVVVLNTAFATVLLPTAIFLGLPWGLKGVALAWPAAFPLVLAGALLYSRSRLGFGLTDCVREAWRPAVGATIMYAIVFSTRTLLPESGLLLQLLILVGVGIISYSSTAMLLTRKELSELRAAALT